ncbi:MAG: GNAT family N-acetyltransferase [Anaerolineae bacterium]|nr:GNAT family N-acetyltransferase [Anaerolineae bacterium]
MTVRAAKPTDARGIARVHIRAWQIAYRGLLPDYVLDDLSVDNSERRWQMRFIENTTQTLVAEDNGRIVGFVTLGASRDDDVDRQQIGEIYAFYIEPGMCRQGHGRALWVEALALLREQGFSEVMLWVLRDNHRAISFYQAVGFTADGGAKTELWRDQIEIQQVRYRQAL